jgi:polyhydroxybutyrate depolymerase
MGCPFSRGYPHPTGHNLRRSRLSSRERRLNLPARLPRRGRRLHIALAGLVAAALALAAVVVSGWTRVGAQASDDAVLGVFGVPGWTATQHVLRVGSLERAYLLAQPVGRVRGERLPVVVLLHGRNMTAAGIARTSGLLGGERAVVVLPAGYRRSWNAGGCCGAAAAAHVDDVTFLTRLVGQVLADTPDADRGRVFLAGLSNGGRLAYRMACRRPALFSAVAVVEAVPVESCPAVAAPVPLIVVSSTGDPLLRQTASAPRHVIDGVPQPSVDGTLAVWRSLDHCGPAAPDERVGVLVARRWVACGKGVTVELDRYAGGSHSWPRGGGLTPPAQERIWSFFRAATSRTA